jgi:inositol-pentakisphosphate 2-kinase
MSLVQAWKTSGGKGNNLKLFWKGRMILPQQLDETAELLQGDGSLEEVLVHRLSSFLAASPLLAKLKELQAKLDALDIEGLGKMLKEREGLDILDLSSDDIFKLGGEIHLSEYEAFVHRFSANDPAELSTREAIISHLLSASFKDCSMIVQLGKEGGDVKAQLVDCDLKSISRLQRYAKLDQQLVETCRQHIDRGDRLPMCQA